MSRIISMGQRFPTRANVDVSSSSSSAMFILPPNWRMLVKKSLDRQDIEFNIVPHVHKQFDDPTSKWTQRQIREGVEAGIKEYWWNSFVDEEETIGGRNPDVGVGWTYAVNNYRLNRELQNAMTRAMFVAAHRVY